ncbi:hypothetical protein F2Q69_00016468 [Brassica cretica]|uniref:Uncharacterized protein n=1 Tax=Brassica cretica TaxID=69181 RepID=A0A8S9QZT8_BRACR|nr:hypothetical protein F2Q69_00016468 [Brassica cretica]
MDTRVFGVRSSGDDGVAVAIQKISPPGNRDKKFKTSTPSNTSNDMYHARRSPPLKRRRHENEEGEDLLPIARSDTICELPPPHLIKGTAEHFLTV